VVAAARLATSVSQWHLVPFNTVQVFALRPGSARQAYQHHPVPGSASEPISLTSGPCGLLTPFCASSPTDHHQHHTSLFTSARQIEVDVSGRSLSMIVHVHRYASCGKPRVTSCANGLRRRVAANGLLNSSSVLWRLCCCYVHPQHSHRLQQWSQGRAKACNCAPLGRRMLTRHTRRLSRKAYAI
jgi:hypothetical protein